MCLALHSDLLDRAGFAHAFFTRRGGVSSPPWNTLNFSTHTGDDPRAVQANWARGAAHLGIEPQRIYVLRQVHGMAHRIVRGDERQAELMRETGDIALTRSAGIACGVRTADCAAILLADCSSGAVAAVHSGWRGTVQRVVTTAVAELQKLSMGTPDVLAAIGPHIESCCFEVDDDVAGELAQASDLADRAVDRSFAKPHVDLRSIIQTQLVAAGVRSDAVDHVRGCTHCDPERFHSYRRDGQRGGRMLAAIVAH